MSRLDIPEYLEDVDRVAGLDLPWGDLEGRTVVVSGATGMIGSFLVDVVMRLNVLYGLGCRVVALGRSGAKARGRLPYFNDGLFGFVETDISAPSLDLDIDADFVLHLASSTHPRQYASDPIGTVTGNVDGLRNLLEMSARAGARLLFASSVEVYGENRGDVERFDEGYCGYIDCNTLRACYTEAKRLGESLCQAYRSQRGVEAVVARIARVYGPTLLPDDSKALSQFIHRAAAGEDVVLKSAGTQRFSYLYVADAASGILTVLLKGADGEAYNLADPESDVALRDLSSMVADIGGVDLVQELPDNEEATGYSKATVALMDAGKARALGWVPMTPIWDGVRRTIGLIKRGGRKDA